MQNPYNQEDMDRYELAALVIRTLLYNYEIDGLHGNPIYEEAVKCLEEIAADCCLPDINALIVSVERELDALALDDNFAAEGFDDLDPDAPIPYAITGEGASACQDDEDDDPAHFRAFPHHQPRIDDIGCN